jgi:hypothetical protein
LLAERPVMHGRRSGGSASEKPSISAGPRAFSLSSLVAQRDAGIGRWTLRAAASSCAGGLGRGGRLRRGVPGHGRLPGSGPLDDPGPVPISDPGSRSRTPAASGSSWPGLPPLALCVMTGDQFRRQDDGPVWYAPADGGASAMAIRKTLSAADAGRPSLATAMYKYSGRPTIRWARNRDCQVASDA